MTLSERIRPVSIPDAEPIDDWNPRPLKPWWRFLFVAMGVIALGLFVMFMAIVLPGCNEPPPSPPDPTMLPVPAAPAPCREMMRQLTGFMGQPSYSCPRSDHELATITDKDGDMWGVCKCPRSQP